MPLILIDSKRLMIFREVLISERGKASRGRDKGAGASRLPAERGARRGDRDLNRNPESDAYPTEPPGGLLKLLLNHVCKHWSRQRHPCRC